MAKVAKDQITNLEELSTIIVNSRQRLNGMVEKLKKRADLAQDIEFSVTKVEAELLSLESSIEEIRNPSDVMFSADKKAVLNASVGKLLPYFLVNLERLGLQCGIDNPRGEPAQIKALFEKNPEFTEVLLSKAQ